MLYSLHARSRYVIVLALTLIMTANCFIISPSNTASASSTPANASSTQATKDVLSYLYSLSGNQILSGQFNYSGNRTGKTDTLYNWSGKYPAIWGSDFDFGGGAANRQAVVNEAIEQWEAGSLVSLTWHASKPGIAESNCGWSDCIQASTSESEFNTIMTAGTSQYNDLISKMDNVAGYLKQLRDAGVPVLWRPWHEMNGSWFWWGQHEKTDDLWRLMYDRYTNYHGLNNLIWQWNPNAPFDASTMAYSTYYPGHAYVDILAMDLYYADEATDWIQSYYTDLLTVGNNRVVAIGESDYLPEMSVLQAQPKWVFQMTWDGDWFNANTQSEYNTWMNHSYVLSQDEVSIPASASSGETTVDDATTGTGQNQFEYVGTWNSATGTGKYNGSDHYSNTTNSYYQVDFNGTQIKLYGTKDVHHGIAAVSIDGGAEVDVDLYASSRADNTLIWTSPTLSSGSHTVKVRVKGTKNSSSSGFYLTADRVVVSTATVTTIDDATTGTGQNQFEYVGTWNSATGSSKFNGSDHYSNTTNSYYQVDFHGTQIKLYGTKDVHHGIAAVSIDGGAEVDVDFYASSRADNTLIWTSPTLSSGSHTVKVRVKGTKNSSSSGFYLTADRVEITS